MTKFAFTKLAEIPETARTTKMDRRTFRGQVTVKGIRLFGKPGAPPHVQVLVGRRWITVIRGIYASGAANLGITAGGIKARIRCIRRRRKA